MKVSQVVALNAVTADADRTGQLIDLNGIYGFFLQWQVTGGAVTGNIIIEASADGTNFYPVSTTAISTGGFVNLDAQYYKTMRIFFDRTTGLITDIINAQVFCKGI